MIDVYITYNDYLESNRLDICDPDKFILRFITVKERHRIIIQEFLSEFYTKGKIHKVMDELIFCTYTPFSKHLSSFKVNRQRFYAVISEYDFSNSIGNTGKAFYLTVYDVTKNPRTIFIDNKRIQNIGECEDVIQRELYYRRPLNIKWSDVPFE
ncbi:hypothetical protein [Paenibacillus xylanexedens]|uniref:hypothetical protein n=1 Tax=Paenibacillus xylanexedens TaxID=528191 RepID=UPI000F524DA4|nr:hypothetical protein [Paenibacillus xylanexedens]